MIYLRPAYEQVTIAHGGSTVTLRPSLRAAVTLEARFGFPALLRGLDEGSFTIISEIILTGSINRQDAAAFLFSQAGRPLSFFIMAMRQPLAELVAMLMPASDPQAKPVTNPGKPVAWADFYADLYEKATGWLGWTPETTWNATPTEIDRAYSGHIAKLKAIHGSSSEKEEKQPVASDPDAAFDRSALETLRESIARHGR